LVPGKALVGAGFEASEGKASGRGNCRPTLRTAACL